jgi:hypothetical protein
MSIYFGLFPSDLRNTRRSVEKCIVQDLPQTVGEVAKWAEIPKTCAGRDPASRWAGRKRFKQSRGLLPFVRAAPARIALAMADRAADEG